MTADSASDYRSFVTDLSGVLVLWDIDGTLVTHAPSPRDRHAHAVSTVLGREVERLPAGIGKTDRQILIELFADHIPSDAEIEQAFAVIDDVTAQDMLTASIHCDCRNSRDVDATCQRRRRSFGSHRQQPTSGTIETRGRRSGRAR